MTQHVDILEQPEPLGRSLLWSVGLHVILLVAMVIGAKAGGRTERWGDPLGGGGVVGVNPVSSIPMPPRSGEVNRVANDTESRVPQPPPKARAQEKTPREDPNAIALKSRRQKRTWSEIAASRQRYRPSEEQPNQLYSAAGRALVSPMMGLAGSGGVGVGAGSPLGDRFGAYAALMQRLIAQKWVTTGVDSALRTAPPVIVSFVIRRDGSINDVRVVQSSGNTVLDLSAQRAILDVGRFQPLPQAFERDSARIEIVFELKR